MSLPMTQLLVFRFAGETRFEGEMLGAVERIEANPSARVLDLLFVRRDAETGQLQAFWREAERAAGPGAAIEFRLDPDARRRSTERAVRASPGFEQLTEGLAPDAALAGVLIENGSATALVEAAERMGGEPALIEFVEARSLTAVLSRLVGCLNPPGP